MNLKPPSCYNPLPILKGSIDDAAPWANQCCPLASLSKGFAYPEGSCSSGVLIISDKLSKDDALDGFFLRPHTAAGSILNRALSAAGVARDQVGIYGVVACNPPNGSLNGESYEHDSIAHCAKNLEKVYNHYQHPPVILALGSIAARTLTGLTGERLSLDMIQGFPLAPEGRTVPFMLGRSIVVPSYSPEYIERGNSQLLLVLIRDIRFAFQLAQRLKARFSDVPQVQAIFDALQHKPQYALHANHFHLSTLYQQMKDGYVKRLSYDFETVGKVSDNALLESGDATYQAFTNQHITQVNFSIDRNQAIVVDYDAQTAPIVQDILACTPMVPKIAHNGYCFDQPVARYNGFEIRGRHIDTLWCLGAKTQIRVEGAKWMSIAKYVNTRDKRRIATLSNDGTFKYTKVLNWRKQHVKNQQWISIKTNGSKCPMILTPDHKVWIGSECGKFWAWKEASEVQLGDLVKVNRGHDELIEGSLLGDGHISSTRTLSWCHGMPQFEYLKAKADCMGVTVKLDSGENRHDTCHASVSIPAHWKALYYGEGKRLFRPPSGAAALAIWYMDDGGFYHNRRKGKEYGNGRVLLAINRYAHCGTEVLSYFRKLIGHDCEFTGGKMIRISKDSLQRFFAIIAPFVHPSMKYKLDERYHDRYNGWLETPHAITAKVKEIKPVESTQVRYCVDVEESTNAFFTRAGLVHNCFHHIYPDLPGKGKANKSEAEGASLSSNDGDEDGALAPLQFCASFYGFPLPWKHLFKLDPHLYGAYDSDACLWVNDGCNASLEALGLTESHEKYVVQLRLVLDDMERRGLPCSPKKLLELSNHLAEMLKESSFVIRTCVPDEALSTTPAKGYAKTPKALLEGVEQAIEEHISNGGERETFNVASYALSKRYVWKSHSLIGQRCSCVKITKNKEDTLPKCPHCLGTGLKATVRKIPCKQCLNGSGRIDCLNCKGEGFTSTVRVPKPRAKGKARRAKRSVVVVLEAEEQMSLFPGEEEEAEHCETPKIRMEINFEEMD